MNQIGGNWPLFSPEKLALNLAGNKTEVGLRNLSASGSTEIMKNEAVEINFGCMRKQITNAISSDWCFGWTKEQLAKKHFFAKGN